ncbi:glycosyl hydrolase 115 family protein [Mucilaginibacter polytrichastri]|uniref:Gylcosyl hydrolase 115 C-terminal domain-containing protein n=1 Tax=Mucilaginibacter polytrichastri TaxID=1302689 RepID=A0A1Q5ZS67_9SPHI|nr:glycosyl hydrolase 115 family protein [Mucilaginibacter polytrichastri]OKS84606.1 hypothetical protein RG47T_0038 [Mucilaginibacter polytrichastri]SFT02398.1 Glycosyl hydrolase family 115 [Mucilaginibacter polytrichastri]
MQPRIWILSLLIVVIPFKTFAIGKETYISTIPGKGAFALSTKGKSAPLYVNSDDFPGVIRALKDLKSDIGKVTNHEPDLIFDKVPREGDIIIVGTIGKSAIIDQLAQSGKIDISSIRNKWEHFILQVVNNPLPGVARAFVIAGSDKRGTIYGIYDVSEKIGVSPWYYWADVPIMHKNSLYVKDGKYAEGPSVKYRGIFINDEAPDLTSWVKSKFGTVKKSQNPPIREGVPNYNHEFYAKVFELLLRLKANYLWPAMWSNAFNEDDPENPRLADEYGIVMGTSHQEPMLRSQQEWDRRYIRTLGNWNYKKHPDTLAEFWRGGIRRNKNFESIITMGLRGANDSEIEGTLQENIAMVEKIVKSQQQIINEELGAQATTEPQVWCLYKEIMEYYNNGMRVPDNITLLWADDNWGNIRRLPDAAERQRPGGAGVYYHFDYHGDPRSYEWINTNPLAKIWDQMSLAKQYGADRIWIVNVGHFRGYELPLEYFMNLAWNTKKWTNNNINEYTRLWAAREFGATYANDIADILAKYTKYNGRRKPESLTASTYSLVNYNEAENVVADYAAIEARANVIYKNLPVEMRDAFYQIVLFPVTACYQVNRMYLAAAKNKLYASQHRASTNVMAFQTRDLFRKDSTLMDYYNHTFAGGKWNHFMDETHIGYTTWAPPKVNNLNAIKLTELTVPDAAGMGVSMEGTELSWPATGTQLSLPAFDNYSNKAHYIEVFNRGKQAFKYHITTGVPWVTVSEPSSDIGTDDKKVWFRVNPSKLPIGNSQGVIRISGAGTKVDIKVTGFRPLPGREVPKGFIESGGVIAIEAEHFSKNISNNERQWIKVEDYGLTLSGMRASAPANEPAATPLQTAPCLEYPIYLFSKDTAQITLVTSPLLNIMPGRDIKIAVSVDEEQPVYVTNVPDKFKVHWSNPAWAQTVVNQARQSSVKLRFKKPGRHTLKVWMIDPGVIVEKVIINTGGLKSSYLGPNESVSRN